MASLLRLLTILFGALGEVFHHLSVWCMGIQLRCMESEMKSLKEEDD